MNLATKKVHISRDVIFHEKIFPFVLAPDDSSFSSILQMLTHSVNMPCMPGKINIFVVDEMLDNLTPHEVTDNQVTNITYIYETSVDIHDSTPQEPQKLRRTSRTINTPSYIKDYLSYIPSMLLCLTINLYVSIVFVLIANS